MRLETDDPDLKVFLGRPQGERKHGRPKLRWQDGLEASVIKARIQGFPGLLTLIGSELHMIEIGLYGTLFGQAPRKILSHMSNKAIESNSHYFKFISRKGRFIAEVDVKSSHETLKFYFLY